MPSIHDLTTVQLLNVADGTDTQTDWTPAEALDELKDRIVPQNFSVVAFRGGVRPTHQPLNP